MEKNDSFKEEEQEEKKNDLEFIDTGDKKTISDSSFLVHTPSSASIQSDHMWKDFEQTIETYSPKTADQSLLDQQNLPEVSSSVDSHPLIDAQEVSIRSIIFDGADELLNVESFTIKEASNKLKDMYIDWLLDEHRSGKELCMEDFILMSCFLCAIGEIASNLTKLSTVAVSFNNNTSSKI
jgi:hypothetical protein